MDIFLQDLRRGARRLARHPGFAAVAILTLALGIGANTAIFSLVRGVLIEPLPYHAPDRLVMLWQRAAASDVTWFSLRELVEYRSATRSFTHLDGYTTFAGNLTEGVEPERVVAGALTGNYFATLGVPAALGRTFTESDAAVGASDVVVVGWHLWQRRWGGAPDLVGRTIRVNSVPRTVLGVMPADFRLPLDYRQDRPTELWVPQPIDRAAELSWGDRSYFLAGRLAPGVTHAQAAADLDAAMRRWCAAGFLDDECEGRRREPVPLGELVVGDIRPVLLLLFGAVGLVLLVACANVANLLLAGADARRREMATQAAIGAARSRLVRQLLTESGLIAAAGAIVGLSLAWMVLQGLLALTPIHVIRARAIELDPVVLGFTALLALTTTVLAGLAPALQLSRPDLATLAGAARSDPASLRRGVRQGLVVAETALSVVLVIGAALLVRSFIALRGTDLGYQTDHRLTLRLALPASEYPEAGQSVRFYQQLRQRVDALAGVRSAGAARILPLSRTIGDWSITIEGRPRIPSENPNGDWQVVTTGYLETMGVHLISGRFLSDDDGPGSTPVALVNQTMADRYWPDGALGQRFHLGTATRPWITIVGITRDVRHNAVIEEQRAEMYLPHAQFADQTGFAPLGMTLVVRTVADPRDALPAVREQIRALDPALPLSEVATMDQVAASALAPQRFSAGLLALFAALAMVLAAIGLYGVVSFTAARRTHELGIRMALGATPGSVMGLVVREGVALAGAGVAVGLLGAVALTRLLTHQLYGITPRDPLTFAAVPLLLALVALTASYLPARRAARVSPLTALRE